MFKQQFISEIAFKYNIPILTLENIWTRIINTPSQSDFAPPAEYSDSDSDSESESESEIGESENCNHRFCLDYQSESESDSEVESDMEVESNDVLTLTNNMIENFTTSEIEIYSYFNNKENLCSYVNSFNTTTISPCNEDLIKWLNSEVQIPDLDNDISTLSTEKRVLQQSYEYQDIDINNYIASNVF